MDTRRHIAARWSIRAANLLLAASLFLVLVWFRASAYLFVAGAATLVAGWLLGEDSLGTEPAAQDCR